MLCWINNNLYDAEITIYKRDTITIKIKGKIKLGAYTVAFPTLQYDMELDFYHSSYDGIKQCLTGNIKAKHYK